MKSARLVAPPQTTTVSFALEPAHNVATSLMLLSDVERTAGLDEWVYETAGSLAPDLARTNALVINGLGATDHLGDGSWPSFPAWVDDLEARDATSLRDSLLDRLVTGAAKMPGVRPPTPAELLGDRDAYVSLVERMHAPEETCCDTALTAQAHELLTEPSAMQGLMVNHLRTIWADVLAEEWTRRLPFLQQSVAGFAEQPVPDVSLLEAVRLVADRELPGPWTDWAEETREIIFIPSPHLGPYLSTSGPVSGTLRMAFGARLPHRVSAGSLAISRSELLMRLSALADETRLRILQLLADEGELSAADIEGRLELSQSATSRHVRQLTATGYLTVRKQEGIKLYKLNRPGIGGTLDTLEELLG
jgi:DNA-binding transcriptional ArsR family regulator